MIEFDAGVFHGLSAGDYDAFDDAAGRADALFNQEATQASDLRIFLAPEYLFSAVGTTQRGATTIGSMSSGKKLDIYKKLKRTSSAYSDMLIVAGSIAYAKGGGFFKSQKHLSVCPVLANGQILLKCYKQNYDQFQSESSRETWDTKSNGLTFAYRGLTFGIEICLDHLTSYKTLKTALNGAQVDIQLLVSAGMAPMASSVAARNQGLVINCDMGGKGGGNGITAVTGYAKGVASIGARNAALIRTTPLTSGGQVSLYGDVLN
jgi:predicted amidohydrolase